MILRSLYLKGIVIPPPSLLAENLAKWTELERIDFNQKVRNQFAPRIEQLRKRGLWGEMENSEIRFMEADALELAEQQLLEATWLSESVACLLWALEYVPEVPPYDQRANTELMKLEFNKSLILRPLEAIKKNRDLAELWHWRSRTRQLQESGHMPDVIAGGLNIDKVLQITSTKAAGGGTFFAPINNDFPAFGKAYRDVSFAEFSLATSIALERHRAFNWLCGYAPGNRWSDTPTET